MYHTLSCLMVVLCSSGLVNAAAFAPPGQIDFDGASFAPLSPAEVELLTEYVKHYRKLESFYGNVRIEGKETFFQQSADESGGASAPGTDIELKAENAFTYRARDSTYFRLDQTRRVDGDEKSETQITIVKPDESFLLQVDSESKRTFLNEHGKNTEEYMSRLDFHWFHIAPFSLAGQRLAYLLFTDREHFTIESVTESELADESFVTISTRLENDRGKVTRNIRLDRNLGWAVTSIDNFYYEVGASSPFLVKEQRCSYTPDNGSTPRLREASFSFVKLGDNSDRELLRKYAFTISSITEESIPLSVFDARRLLGHRIGLQQPRRNWPAIIGSVIGIILLLIGLSLRRRSTRRKRSSLPADPLAE